MENLLEIRAGKTALDHIRKNGLSPSDIRVITGASGAAKWLSIYGLYRAIFSQWLTRAPHPVFLFGTSIGAWALAAGAQKNPGQAFDRFKRAYIGQRYRGRITPEKVTLESFRILDMVFGAEQVGEILDHPFLTLSFSAVRCRGPLASENGPLLAGGLLSAWMLNLLSRKSQRLFFERTLFYTASSEPGLELPLNLSPGRQVKLTSANFWQALLASGSIPIVMAGIRDIIGGAPKGMYRDGGLLDYHPAFPMKGNSQGLILYPHFYPWIIPGWFDKKFPRRRACGSILDRTVLICPSKSLVDRLPYGRIPDRKDFIRFAGQDADRFRVWEEAAQISLELGQAFLSATKSGRIAGLVKEF